MRMVRRRSVLRDTFLLSASLPFLRPAEVLAAASSDDIALRYVHPRAQQIGAFHGFDILAPATRVARWFKAAKFEALRRGFSMSAAA